MKKVVVLGGGGLVGLRLCLGLLRAGHLPEAVVFHPPSAAALSRLGIPARLADVRQRGALLSSLEGADAAVLTACSVPADPARAEFCRSVRDEAPAAAAAAAATMGVPSLLVCSLLAEAATTVVRGGEDFFCERSSSLTGAEERARVAMGRAPQSRLTVMRLARLVAADCPRWQSLAASLLAASISLSPSHSQVESAMVQADDAASSLLVAVENELANRFPVNAANNFRLFHVVGCSVTAADEAVQLAAAMGAPEPRRISSTLMARLKGVPEPEPPVRASGDRFAAAFPEWRPRYGDFASMAAQMRAVWKAMPQTRHLVAN